jgi:hypothetical protein
MIIGVYAGAESLENLAVTTVRRSHWYRPNNATSCYKNLADGL